LLSLGRDEPALWQEYLDDLAAKGIDR
jgi:DUF971 family protein